ERDAALVMLEQIPGRKPVTVGGDKGFDTRDFVAERRHLGVNLAAVPALYVQIDVCPAGHGVRPKKLTNTRNQPGSTITNDENQKDNRAADQFFSSLLEAEGIPCEPGYPPVHSLDVFQSRAYRQRLAGEQRRQKHAFLKQPYPNAQRAFSEAIWIPQPALLGDEEDMEEIAGAVRKLKKHSTYL